MVNAYGFKSSEAAPICCTNIHESAAICIFVCRVGPCPQGSSLRRGPWSTPAKAWWDSPDDPSIRVLKIAPKDAQYWDSRGTVVSYVKMFAAAMTDSRPELGDNVKVKL